MSELDQVDQFMQGLKEPLRKQCIWDPARRGPFQDLQELIAYATAHDVSHRVQPESASPDAEFSQYPAHDSLAETNMIKPSLKRRREDDSSLVPQRARPFHAAFTPNYRGTPEAEYLMKHHLCFHCIQPGHSVRDCPVKHDERKPATVTIQTTSIADIRDINQQGTAGDSCPRYLVSRVLMYQVS